MYRTSSEIVGAWFRWCVSLCLAAQLMMVFVDDWMHAHGWPVVTIWLVAWDKILMVWLGRDPSSYSSLPFSVCF